MSKNNKLYVFLIIIALVIKSAFFIYKMADYNYLNSNYPGIIGVEGGDAKSYISPIDNFITYGYYYDDHRMPGYGFFYLIFKLILKQTFALNALLVFQIIIDSISVLVLAKLSLFFSRNRMLFLITFSAYCISTFVSVFNVFLLSEVLCTSFLIYSIYFILKPDQNFINYLLSGVFITASVFMRPIIAPLLIIFVGYILAINLKQSNKIKLKFILIFLIPFIIIDGAWIIRNVSIYNKIIPLQKSVNYSGVENTYLLSLTYFLTSYGGSSIYWNPKAEVTFFKPFKLGNSVSEVSPSKDIFTSKFNYDSLVLVKTDIHKIDSLGMYTKSAEELNRKTILRLDRFTESIKLEKPFLYYISSRLKILYNFTVHSGTYNLFNKPSDELNTFDFTAKIFYSLIYCVVCFFGFLGSIYYLFFHFYNKKIVLVATTTLYLLLIYPFVFKMDEYRYLVTAYPFLLLMGIFFLYSTFLFLLKKINSYKKIDLKKLK